MYDLVFFLRFHFLLRILARIGHLARANHFGKWRAYRWSNHRGANSSQHNSRKKIFRLQMLFHSYDKQEELWRTNISLLPSS